MATTYNPVKYARGVKLLIMVGDGGSPEVFTAFCTVNAARSVTGDAATNDFNIPDCDDPDALGWLVREKVSLSYSAQGAGILNTPDVMTFTEWLADPDSRNCQIVVDVPAADGGVVFAGAFHLTKFEITGDRGSKMEATLNLISDGEVVVTATPAALAAAA
jgi:Phage tail tube protein